MDQKSTDAGVVQSALAAHLELMRAVEDGHRRAAAGIKQHPQIRRAPQDAIAIAAAHTARCAGYAQRASFVDELLKFPAAGLRALTGYDMNTLQVPTHIGTAAVPEELRPVRTTISLPKPPRPTPAPAASAPPAPDSEHTTGPAPAEPPRRRSFLDILYGRRA
ncbi:hypothetical protein [Nesterenkonia alba]|uniref:hypothetical protein n=1 Tax=Nesterenkonia alba TaxID=515814 RepID=UPI000411D608|nr:hypothetical protein [Nesterenkonia alba]